MSSRRWIIFLTLFLIATIAVAKKKKQTLPDYVLNARTVAVVIDPDAGEPVGHPTSNRDAQEDVERAITKWGRLQVDMDFETADLVIVIRKGNANGMTIHNSPADEQPPILSSDDSNVRMGAQNGRPPSDDEMQNGSPRISADMLPKDDSFVVYFGNRPHPLEASPIWRYMAKDALNAPIIPAVEEFKKAIEESEQQKQKP